MSIDYTLLKRQVKSVGIAIGMARDESADKEDDHQLIEDLEGVESMLSYILEEGDRSNLNPLDDHNTREGADVINEKELS